MRKILFPTLLILTSLSLVASAATTPAKTVTAPPSIVAEVGGDRITTEELDKTITTELTALQEQIYTLKRQRLETMINERVLSNEAARQKLSLTELMDKEVIAKIGLVTEQEVDTFYQANKERIKEGPQVRQQIRQYLQNQRLTGERDKYLQALRSKVKIAVNLPSPPRVRVELSESKTPLFKGAASAPVTIVKFEDFQCPYCKQTQATLAQLESRYGDKIKLVHRDFPIDSLHPLARRAAEGARCANEQGKFWIYHDKLYATNLTSDPNQLSALAKEVDMNVASFDRCLANGQFKTAVQDDFEVGQKLGVTATPAFFVNGRLLLGAQPLENFARIVDEELDSANTKASAQ